VALLVHVVVDPRRGPVGGVFVDRVDLPVRGPEHRPAVEGQAGQVVERELEQVGEMLVGALLPAGCPNELEIFR
jgi:hypothetical protein